MDKNKTELEEFMGDLAKTPDPLENKQSDPFNHLDEKEESETVEDKEQKPLPFNKDPKIQKFIEKEISKRIENLKPQVVETTPTTTEDDDFYVRLIGNDTPEKVAMIREYKAREERLLEQAEERAFNRLSAKEQEAIKADQEAEEELESAFDTIEENFGVDITSNAPLARKTRQEFVSFVEKIAPKDSNGDIVDYPDMQSAWETFSEMKKATSTPSRAKELAARSMQRSAETTSEPTLRRGGTPFSNSDNFIESLSK
jgi:hypothetical protein